MTTPTERHDYGVYGSGSQNFTPGDVTRIVDALTPAQALTTAELVRITGVDGRTIRAVLSAIDGVTVLLAGGEDGYRIARSADEADAFTRRLENQAGKMLDRARRRRVMAATLPRLQGSLLL